MKWLITGFEPFRTRQGEQLPENPTGRMAEALAERLPGGTAHILPVEFRKNPVLWGKLLDEVVPDGWLGLGLAPGRSRVEFEMVALNLQHADSPDNADCCPRLEPVIEGGPLALAPTLPAQPFLDRLRGAGVQAGLSFHAGTFLCNQLFYLGTHAATVGNRLAFTGFVHVPFLESESTVVDALAASLLECPNVCVEPSTG